VMQWITIITGGIALINAAVMIERYWILSLRQSKIGETSAWQPAANNVTKIPELPDRVFSAVQGSVRSGSQFRGAHRTKHEKHLAVTDWRVSSSRLRPAHDKGPLHGGGGSALADDVRRRESGFSRTRFPQDRKKEITEPAAAKLSPAVVNLDI